jgi:hypothetical protein
MHFFPVPLREDFAYSARDQVTTQKRYSDLAASTLVGSSTLSYDGVMRLTNQQHLNGAGANLANFTNLYDLAGRITSEKLNGLDVGIGSVAARAAGGGSGEADRPNSWRRVLAAVVPEGHGREAKKVITLDPIARIEFTDGVMC